MCEATNHQRYVIIAVTLLSVALLPSAAQGDGLHRRHPRYARPRSGVGGGEYGDSPGAGPGSDTFSRHFDFDDESDAFSAGADGSTPPRPESQLVWRGRPHVYRDLVEQLHPAFGTRPPPGARGRDGAAAGAGSVARGHRGAGRRLGSTGSADGDPTDASRDEGRPHSARFGGRAHRRLAMTHEDGARTELTYDVEHVDGVISLEVEPSVLGVMCTDTELIVVSSGDTSVQHWHEGDYITGGPHWQCWDEKEGDYVPFYRVIVAKHAPTVVAIDGNALLRWRLETDPVPLQELLKHATVHFKTTPPPPTALERAISHHGRPETSLNASAASEAHRRASESAATASAGLQGKVRIEDEDGPIDPDNPTHARRLLTFSKELSLIAYNWDTERHQVKEEVMPLSVMSNLIKSKGRGFWVKGLKCYHCQAHLSVGVEFVLRVSWGGLEKLTVKVFSRAGAGFQLGITDLYVPMNYNDKIKLEQKLFPFGAKDWINFPAINIPVWVIYIRIKPGFQLSIGLEGHILVTGAMKTPGFSRGQYNQMGIDYDASRPPGKRLMDLSSSERTDDRFFPAEASLKETLKLRIFLKLNIKLRLLFYEILPIIFILQPRLFVFLGVPDPAGRCRWPSEGRPRESSEVSVQVQFQLALIVQIDPPGGEDGVIGSWKPFSQLLPVKWEFSLYGPLQLWYGCLKIRGPDPNAPLPPYCEEFGTFDFALQEMAELGSGVGTPRLRIARRSAQDSGEEVTVGDGFGLPTKVSDEWHWADTNSDWADAGGTSRALVAEDGVTPLLLSRTYLDLLLYVTGSQGECCSAGVAELPFSCPLVTATCSRDDATGGAVMERSIALVAESGVVTTNAERVEFALRFVPDPDLVHGREACASAESGGITFFRVSELGELTERVVIGLRSHKRGDTGDVVGDTTLYISTSPKPASSSEAFTTVNAANTNLSPSQTYREVTLQIGLRAGDIPPGTKELYMGVKCETPYTAGGITHPDFCQFKLSARNVVDLVPGREMRVTGTYQLAVPDNDRVYCRSVPAPNAVAMILEAWAPVDGNCDPDLFVSTTGATQFPDADSANAASREWSNPFPLPQDEYLPIVPRTDRVYSAVLLDSAGRSRAWHATVPLMSEKTPANAFQGSYEVSVRAINVYEALPGVPLTRTLLADHTTAYELYVPEDVAVLSISVTPGTGTGDDDGVDGGYVVFDDPCDSPAPSADELGPLPDGSRSDIAAVVQALLATALGWGVPAVGGIDGQWGSLSAAALEAFETDVLGRQATGILDQEAWEGLCEFHSELSDEYDVEAVVEYTLLEDAYTPLLSRTSRMPPLALFRSDPAFRTGKLLVQVRTTGWWATRFTLQISFISDLNPGIATPLGSIMPGSVRFFDFPVQPLAHEVTVDLRPTSAAAGWDVQADDTHPILLVAMSDRGDSLDEVAAEHLTPAAYPTDTVHYWSGGGMVRQTLRLDESDLGAGRITSGAESERVAMLRLSVSVGRGVDGSLYELWVGDVVPLRGSCHSAYVPVAGYRFYSLSLPASSRGVCVSVTPTEPRGEPDVMLTSTRRQSASATHEFVFFDDAEHLDAVARLDVLPEEYIDQSTNATIVNAANITQSWGSNNETRFDVRDDLSSGRPVEDIVGQWYAGSPGADAIALWEGDADFATGGDLEYHVVVKEFIGGSHVVQARELLDWPARLHGTIASASGVSQGRMLLGGATLAIELDCDFFLPTLAADTDLRAALLRGIRAVSTTVEGAAAYDFPDTTAGGWNTYALPLLTNAVNPVWETETGPVVELQAPERVVITLPPLPGYNRTSDERLVVRLPGVVLSSGEALDVPGELRVNAGEGMEEVRAHRRVVAMRAELATIRVACSLPESGDCVAPASLGAPCNASRMQELVTLLTGIVPDAEKGEGGAPGGDDTPPPVVSDADNAGAGSLDPKTAVFADLLPVGTAASASNDVAGDCITSSVGTGGVNDPADVSVVTSALVGLGFTWAADDADGLARAITLFQCVKNGRSRSDSSCGDGRVDPGGSTEAWLRARNAPEWVRLQSDDGPTSGPGYEFNDQPSDHSKFGTSWLRDAVVLAGEHYETNWRAAHPDAAVFSGNDASRVEGGPSPPHSTHQSGINLDFRLPHTDGNSGGITVSDARYDRAAMRAQLKSLWQTGLVGTVYLNDETLIDEGLCVWMRSHDNHGHLIVTPPTRIEAETACSPGARRLTADGDKCIAGSVGLGGDNKAQDVELVVDRFKDLGYDWASGTTLPQIIRMFQCAVKSFPKARANCGDGRIDPGGATIKWLFAANAPQWLLLDGSGTGWEAADESWDSHHWGTDWLADALSAAGAHYDADYLSDNPTTPVISGNDGSLAHGGDTPDHKTHETGLDLDCRLPKTDGTRGGITFNDASWDEAATRAQIEAWWKTGKVRRLYFNKQSFIDDGIAEYASGHENHYHVNLKAEVRQEGLGSCATSGVDPCASTCGGTAGQCDDDEPDIPADGTAAVATTGNMQCLSDSVGSSGANLAEDVAAVRSRLVSLGFTWASEGSLTELASTIRLYQCMTASSSSKSASCGDGRVDAGGSTERWLRSANGPRWTQLDSEGPGYVIADEQSDTHHHGSQWLLDAIAGAGSHYEANWRAAHPTAAKLSGNDGSMPQGGDTPDHATHETGLNLDLRLPKTTGGSGGITVSSATYDRDAMRAQLTALRAQPGVSKLYLNDAVLVSEGLCSAVTGHDNHAHVIMEAPTRSDGDAQPCSQAGRRRLQRRTTMDDLPCLTGSVGAGGENAPEDVVAVTLYLVSLGFSWAGATTTALANAIALFQCIVDSSLTQSEDCGSGRVHPDDDTFRWLRAENAPTWVDLAASHAGYEFSDDASPSHQWGTALLRAALVAAGEYYNEQWIAAHPGAPKISATNAAVLEGGQLPNQGVYETGLELDVRLPRTDGSSGNVVVSDPAFDRDAMRAQLQAFWSHDAVSSVYLNDATLIGEGLCEYSAGHNDHAHVVVQTAARVDAVVACQDHEPASDDEPNGDEDVGDSEEAISGDCITGSVGANGVNEDADVDVIVSRLKQLGFDWTTPDNLVTVVRLFQCIIKGRTKGVAACGDGRVDPDGTTIKWMFADNAPHWQRVDGFGVGFEIADEEWDNHHWGTDWLVLSLQAAGEHYETNFRATHPNAPVISGNDASYRQGGHTSDHSTHQTGLSLDVRLPKTDGTSGGITYTSSLYDRDAARAQLQAFEQLPAARVYFNDPVLREEGLCVYSGGHDNHFHLDIQVPDRLGGDDACASDEVGAEGEPVDGADPAIPVPNSETPLDDTPPERGFATTDDTPSGSCTVAELADVRVAQVNDVNCLSPGALVRIHHGGGIALKGSAAQHGAWLQGVPHAALIDAVVGYLDDARTELAEQHRSAAVDAAAAAGVPLSDAQLQAIEVNAQAAAASWSPPVLNVTHAYRSFAEDLLLGARRHCGLGATEGSTGASPFSNGLAFAATAPVPEALRTWLRWMGFTFHRALPGVSDALGSGVAADLELYVHDLAEWVSDTPVQELSVLAFQMQWNANVQSLAPEGGAETDFFDPALVALRLQTDGLLTPQARVKISAMPVGGFELPGACSCPTQLRAIPSVAFTSSSSCRVTGLGGPTATFVVESSARCHALQRWSQRCRYRIEFGVGVNSAGLYGRAVVESGLDGWPSYSACTMH